MRDSRDFNVINIAEAIIKQKKDFIPLDYNKENLWKLFKQNFKTLFNKDFIETEDSIYNVSVLFYYFLRSDDFFKHKSLRANLSKPSFQKGLLLIGGYGIGKTNNMKTFERCFAELNNNRFKMHSTNHLVQEFESCSTPIDKADFFLRLKRGIQCYDDLTSERLASNFGKHNIMKEIFEERYMQNRLTHITMNYKSGSNLDVETTLNFLGEIYGDRFYDRIFEMFNIVELKGKSLRL
jgi:DNA replication protein DnaC